MLRAPCSGLSAPSPEPRAQGISPRSRFEGPNAHIPPRMHVWMGNHPYTHTWLYACMHAAPDPRKMLICLYVCTHTYKHINLFQDAGMHAASAGRELPGDAGCLLAKLSSGNYDPPQWQSRRRPHPPLEGSTRWSISGVASLKAGLGSTGG